MPVILYACVRVLFALLRPVRVGPDDEQPNTDGDKSQSRSNADQNGRQSPHECFLLVAKECVWDAVVVFCGSLSTCAWGNLNALCHGPFSYSLGDARGGRDLPDAGFVVQLQLRLPFALTQGGCRGVCGDYCQSGVREGHPASGGAWLGV